MTGEVRSFYIDLFNDYSKFYKDYKNITDEAKKDFKTFDSQHIFTKEDMKLLKRFAVTNVDITEDLVAPLKYAVNLEEFDVVLSEDVNRELEDFQFLTSAQKLQKLRYVNNVRIYGQGRQDKLKDLSSLSAMKSLKDLRINMCSIESIDPILDLDLEYLVLPDNKIKDLNFKPGQMENLLRLDLENNQIKDISSLANLKSLRTLYLYNNQIENIEALSNLSNLEALLINENKIKDISPLKSLNLKRLYLQSNPLQEDYMDIIKELDVNTLKLDFISLDDYTWLKESIIRPEGDISKLDENNARLYSFEGLQVVLESIGEEGDCLIFKNPLTGLEDEFLGQDEYNEDHRLNENLEFVEDKIKIKKAVLGDSESFSYPIFTSSNDHTYGQWNQPANIVGVVKLIVK